jgi:hypothetical protein
MWAAWRLGVSKKLAAVDPRVLSEYLRLASGTAGATRSELQSELGWKQARESKMSTKLLEADWLEIIKKPKGKAKVESLRMTLVAISAMKELEVSLRALSPTPMAASVARSKRGRLRLPLNRVGNVLDSLPQ